MRRKEKYVQLQSNPPLKETTPLERERETQEKKKKKKKRTQEIEAQVKFRKEKSINKGRT